MTFDPRIIEVPPVIDLTNMLARRERLNCPVRLRAVAAIRLEEARQALLEAEAEHAKAAIMCALSKVEILS